MKITEISDPANLDFIREIIAPFDFDETRFEIILNNFRRELKEINENRIIFLGRINDRNVSTVQLVLKNADNDPELANGKDIAHAHNLWVAKDMHGRGLAKEIMKHLEKKAVELGYLTLTLGVDDYNLDALGLYKNLGFVEFKSEEGRSPGERLLLMRKDLDV